MSTGAGGCLDIPARANAETSPLLDAQEGWKQICCGIGGVEGENPGEEDECEHLQGGSPSSRHETKMAAPSLSSHIVERACTATASPDYSFGSGFGRLSASL